VNTKLVNSAAGVVMAALQQNRTAAGIALALDSAQMLMTPETAAELERLASQVVELQNAMSEHKDDAARARRERDLMRERVSEPFGCTYCGIAQRSHGRQWIASAGVHAWERPSDEQVKARMLARRVARSPLPATPELDQVLEDLTGANLARWEEEQDNARLRLALKSAQRGRHEARDSLQFAEGSRQRWRTATIESEKERDALRARVAELEAQRKADHETWQHDLRTARGEREATAARIAELEAERHTTNEALDDAVQALRADRDRIAELERRIAAEECRCPEPAPLCEGCRCKCHAEQAEASADKLTALFAPTQVLREESYAEAVTPRVQAMRALLDGQRAAVEDPHDGPLAHSYRVSRDLPEMGGAR
jgi:hypothetical protein